MRASGWLLALVPIGTLSCLQRPSTEAPQPVAAELVIAFRDGVATVGLERLPPPGGWEWMDAGQWSPLGLAWQRPDRAAATVDRTAPDWLLLKDPTGGVHRVILIERPDPVPMPDPRRMHDPGRLTDEDRGMLMAIGLVWVVSFVRR